MTKTYTVGARCPACRQILLMQVEAEWDQKTQRAVPAHAEIEESVDGFPLSNGDIVKQIEEGLIEYEAEIEADHYEHLEDQRADERREP